MFDLKQNLQTNFTTIYWGVFAFLIYAFWIAFLGEQDDYEKNFKIFFKHHLGILIFILLLQLFSLKATFPYLEFLNIFIILLKF